MPGGSKGGINMQSFGLNYDVKPEYTEEFKKTLMQLIDVMQSCDGHIETKLFSDVTQPNSMMIYSNWKTKAEFGDFVRSDTFKEAMNEAMAMLEGKPKHFTGQDIRLIKTPE
jgi:quinol monooxygenase YgiN